MTIWDSVLGACVVFLIFLIPTLCVWLPVFGFAYWHRPFPGSFKGYVLAWIATASGTAMLLALLGVVEEIVRN